MKSCGKRFHDEVGKFRFLNELIKVVSPKVGPAGSCWREPRSGGKEGFGKKRWARHPLGCGGNRVMLGNI